MRVQENELNNAITISHYNFEFVWVTYSIHQIFKNLINYYE